MSSFVLKQLQACVVAFLALFISPIPSHADISCKATMYRSFSTVFEEGGKKITYTLSSSNPDWALDGYGYHATASAVCGSCSPEKSYGGVVHIGEMPQPYEKILQHGTPCLAAIGTECVEPEQDVVKLMSAVTTAQDHIDSDFEYIPYLNYTIPKENRMPVFQTDELHSGRFNGYGVIYKIFDPKAVLIPDYMTGLIVFEINDQCASVTGRIIVPIEKAEVLLKNFADAIAIERRVLSE